MKLPRYRSDIPENLPGPGKNGSYEFFVGESSFHLSQFEMHVALLSNGRHTAREVIDLGLSDNQEMGEAKTESELIACLTSLIEKDIVKEVELNDDPWTSPLLITGSARSGTTALTRSLSTHERFSIFNEYSLYSQDRTSRDAWRRIRRMNPDNHPPEEFGKDCAGLETEMLDNFAVPVFDRVIRNWLFERMDASDKVYGDKMPYRYLARMHAISEKYPGAKFLVTLRDGRAVIASQIRRYKAAENGDAKPSPWMSPSVAEAEELWLKSASTWLELRANPPAPCLEVRYEETVNDPEAAVRKICEFVDIPYRVSDFGGFFDMYAATNTYTWREEFEDIDRQLSGEFLEALAQLGYR